MNYPFDKFRDLFYFHSLTFNISHCKNRSRVYHFLIHPGRIYYFRLFFIPLLPNDHLYLGRCVSTTFSMTFTTSFWVSFWVSLSLKYDFLIKNLECKNKFFFTKSALFLSLLIVNAVSSQLPYTITKTRTNISACPSFSFIECYSVFNILVQRYYQGCIIFCYRF